MTIINNIEYQYVDTTTKESKAREPMCAKTIVTSTIIEANKESTNIDTYKRFVSLAELSMIYCK